MYVPDNLDAYDTYEREQERLKRLQNENEYIEEFDIEDMPFYMSWKEEYDDR
jgi:hypothetical protein